MEQEARLSAFVSLEKSKFSPSRLLLPPSLLVPVFCPVCVIYINLYSSELIISSAVSILLISLMREYGIENRVSICAEIPHLFMTCY